MFFMSGLNIYTDTFSTFRVVSHVDGGIIKHDRQSVLIDQPCRVYNNPTPEISMSEQAATSNGNNTLCCDINLDVQAGDEIIVKRGARISAQPVSTERYFAGLPNTYIEPFFGVSVDLQHKQVALLNEQRVGGGN